MKHAGNSNFSFIIRAAAIISKESNTRVEYPDVIEKSTAEAVLFWWGMVDSDHRSR